MRSTPGIRSEIRLAIVAFGLLSSLVYPAIVAAQSDSEQGQPAGWYDDGYGCRKYWDGSDYTIFECKETSPIDQPAPEPTTESPVLAPGWYDGGGGCEYYWDGAQATDKRCSNTDEQELPAGWYDGGDGCEYYWDGSSYTDSRCTSPASDQPVEQAPGWYENGPGCEYYWDGTQVTMKRCTDANDPGTVITVLRDGGDVGDITSEVPAAGVSTVERKESTAVKRSRGMSLLPL